MAEYAQPSDTSYAITEARSQGPAVMWSQISMKMTTTLFHHSAGTPRVQGDQVEDEWAQQHAASFPNEYLTEGPQTFVTPAPAPTWQGYYPSVSPWGTTAYQTPPQSYPPVEWPVQQPIHIPGGVTPPVSLGYPMQQSPIQQSSVIEEPQRVPHIDPRIWLGRYVQVKLKSQQAVVGIFHNVEVDSMGSETLLLRQVRFKGSQEVRDFHAVCEREIANISEVKPLVTNSLSPSAGATPNGSIYSISGQMSNKDSFGIQKSSTQQSLTEDEIDKHFHCHNLKCHKPLYPRPCEHCKSTIPAPKGYRCPSCNKMLAPYCSQHCEEAENVP